MPHVDTWYDYKPLPAYPHMGPRDAHIWNQFVIARPNFFDRCVYDMRCGPCPDVDPDMPKHLKDAWGDLCRGRIDVVAESDEAIYVIEVKPRARGEALGQALNNAELYRQEYNPQKKVLPMVVTDIIIPATMIGAQAMGVLLYTPTLP